MVALLLLFVTVIVGAAVEEVTFCSVGMIAGRTCMSRPTLPARTATIFTRDGAIWIVINATGANQARVKAAARQFETHTQQKGQLQSPARHLQQRRDVVDDVGAVKVLDGDGQHQGDLHRGSRNDVVSNLAGGVTPHRHPQPTACNNKRKPHQRQK